MCKIKTYYESLSLFKYKAFGTTLKYDNIRSVYKKYMGDVLEYDCLEEISAVF